MLSFAAIALPRMSCAQCTMGGSFDNPSCADLYRTLGSAWTCASGHCRVTYPSIPAAWTMVASTHANATFYVSAPVPPTTTIFVSQFDSVNNCTSSNDWTYRTPDLTYPAIIGTIPPCPNVGQTYAYHASRYQNGYPWATESLSWSIVGGTIVGNASATISPLTYDTVKVQWNAAGPHRLVCTRYGSGSTMWGAQNCTNHDTIWDGAAAPPAILGPSGVCAGATTANYSASTFPSGFTYNWTCTNGTIVSGQGTQTVSVNWTGSGTLTLTSTSVPCGWTAVASKNVTLSAGAPPVVNLGPNANYCTGTTVTLNAGSGFSSYQWSNLYTTQASLASTAGNYAVTVTNAAGCTASDTVAITFGGTASAPSWPLNQTVCSGGSITPGTYASYLWSTGATAPTILPATNGIYTVTVSNGTCATTGYTNVTMTTPPAPNLGPNTTFCQGSNFTLNAGPGTSYLWSTGATTQTIQPAASGTYSVTVTGSPGCTGTSSVTLTMLPAPVPSVTYFPTVLCPGNQATLNAGFWAAYLWSTGATTPSINVSPPGTWSVTVTDANGCTGSGFVNIVVQPGPTPNLGPNQTVCTGTPVTLNPGTFVSYLWSTGATTQTISPTTSGTYSVTVTNASGCTGTASKTLTFVPLPTPNLGPNQTVCTGTPVTLNPGTYAAYSWSTGATSQTISPTTSGTYSVTVTNANGCTGSSSVGITFLPAPAFSLGADSFMCADTFVVLDGPPGLSTYAWSNAATAPSITVNTGGTYLLTVTDANGCTASDDITITALTDCVFPGDANYDMVADNADILAIGAYYGYTGGLRPGATMQWYGQSLPNWGGALPGSADPKHSDADGNGTVAAADTMAVTLNYGQTHSKGSGVNGGPVGLTVRALADSVYPGDPAWFVVELGDAQNIADSTYGVALRLGAAGMALAAPGIYAVDYSQCWFAPGTSRLDFTWPVAPNSPVDVAVVRTDQTEQSGFGEVLRFAVATDSNLAAVRDLLQITLSNVTFVDADLQVVPVTITNGQIVVSHLVTGAAPAHLAPPTIFPNPTDGWVRVYQSGATVLHVTAMDALGHAVLSRHIETGNALILDTKGIASGIYLLRIETSAGTYVKRLVVE